MIGCYTPHTNYPHQICWRNLVGKAGLLTLCAGNSPVTFPSQMPVTRSFDVFFDLCVNKQWVNDREIADLRRHRAHYDAIVMWNKYTSLDHYSGELFPKLGTKLGKPDRIRVYSVCCIFIQYILLPFTPKSLLCFLPNCRAFCYHCGTYPPFERWKIHKITWDTLGIISAYGPLLQLTYLIFLYIYNMIYIRQAQTKPYQRQITHMGVTVGAYSQLTWEADCHWERSYGIGNWFPEGNDLDMLSIIS